MCVYENHNCTCHGGWNPLSTIIPKSKSMKHMWFFRFHLIEHWWIYKLNLTKFITFQLLIINLDMKKYLKYEPLIYLLTYLLRCNGNTSHCCTHILFISLILFKRSTHWLFIFEESKFCWVSMDINLSSYWKYIV